MIVLDTNVVSEIWHARCDPHVELWFEKEKKVELFLCQPVVAELSCGGNRILMRDGSARFLNLLRRFVDYDFQGRILPLNMASAIKYGEVVARHEMAGRPIGPIDAMIAATCLVHGATLATRNVRDFEGLDLTVVNPFDPSA